MSYWKHKKSGNYYVIACEATLKGETEQPLIVYFSANGRVTEYFARNKEEFYEKFEKVTRPGPDG